MASLLCKLNVPHFLLAKNQSYSCLLKQAAILGVTNQANISFWFFGWRKSSKSAKLPEGQATKRKTSKSVSKCQKKFHAIKGKSKSLQNLKKKKSATKLKLKIGKAKLAERKPSLFSRLFSRKCKNSQVDRRKCILPRKEDQLYEKGDSKSGDLQYHITGPLTCRPPANCKPRPFELQPVSPEAFKLPKAVMFQVMVEALEKERNQCETKKDTNAMEKENVNDEKECTAISFTDYKKPYEEMRPIHKERIFFTCQDGIRAKHVIRPCYRQFNYCNIHPEYHRPFTPCKLPEEFGKQDDRPAKIVLNTCPSKTCP